MSRTSMTPRTWAAKKVEKAVTGYQWNGRIRKSTVTLPAIAVKLLLKEHARAVRIVKRYAKEVREGKYDGKYSVHDDDVVRGMRLACLDGLAALQRGRTGRGK